MERCSQWMNKEFNARQRNLENGTKAAPIADRSFLAFLIHAEPRVYSFRVSPIRFCSTARGTDYRQLARGENWQCEAGFVDVVPGVEATGPEVDAGCDDASELLQVATGKFDERYEPTPATVGLTETLAARSATRIGIEPNQLVGWFRRSFGVPRKLVWDVIRAWIESGAIDEFSNRRWRGTLYQARHPRFSVCQLRSPSHDRTGHTDSTILAVLHGLVPSVLEAEILHAANLLELRVCRRQPLADYLPSPLCVLAESVEAVRELSGQLDLKPPIAVQPIQRQVASVGNVASASDKLRENHQSVGAWNWSACGFRTTETSETASVTRYRRRDVPDAYEVLTKSGRRRHFLSKTWALLVGAENSTLRVFQTDGPHLLIQEQPGVYLPLPVGRWATATSGVCPGPNADGRYCYFFPSANERGNVLQTLWPRTSGELHAAEARRLALLCRSRTLRSDGLITVPDWMRQAFSRVEACDLAHLSVAPRRLHASLVKFARAIHGSEGVCTLK